LARQYGLKSAKPQDRRRQLLQQGTVSPQEFDKAQAEFKDATAQLSPARERLADATIRSPLDGKISARLVSPGQYVEQAQTLVTVVDSDPMKIEFAAPERFLHELRMGQTVNVKLAGLAGKTHTGEVYFIDPRPEPSTRTVDATDVADYKQL
jgi:membrane fusion protein (multidrug efflux system)